MTSAKKRVHKLKKQKEDLDGSKVYRNRDQVEESPRRPSLKQKKLFGKKEEKKSSAQ